MYQIQSGHDIARHPIYAPFVPEQSMHHRKPITNLSMIALQL